jgi:hypothetical protein
MGSATEAQRDDMTIRRNYVSVPTRRIDSMAATVAVLACQFATQDAAAQDTSATVTVDVAECVELESDAARVECFGSQVNAILEAQGNDESEQRPATDPSPDPPLDEPTAAATSEDAAEETLSRPERRVPRNAENRAVGEPAESTADQNEFHGTIVSFQERVPFSYVITLDNGQIWEQVEPKKYPLRPGMEVRIYPTRWGRTYRLSGAGTGGYIRVQRVR